MPTTKEKRPSVKSQAIELVQRLPTGASWDDLMYQIYVRQQIEQGMDDARKGRVHSHASIRKS